MINCINYSRKSDWFLVDSVLSYTDMIYNVYPLSLWFVLLFPTAWSLELTCFTANWIGCEFSVKFSVVVFQFSCSYICSGVVSVIEYFCYSCFEIKIDLVCSNSNICKTQNGIIIHLQGSVMWHSFPGWVPDSGTVWRSNVQHPFWMEHSSMNLIICHIFNQTGILFK